MENEFKEKWIEHIKELNRLKWTLPQENWIELKTIINDLNKIVDIAEKEYKKELKNTKKNLNHRGF